MMLETDKPATSHATDHLANERTFLAWIRTSIAVIGLGFAVAKFGTWLRELSGQSPQSAASHAGVSVPAGMAMIGLGGLFAILAAWRYHAVSRQIEQGTVRASRGLIFSVAGLVVILSIAIVILLRTPTAH